MTNINFINNDTEVSFRKLLWHDSEIILAKCFGFKVDIDSGIIRAEISKTSKKAMYGFISVAFKTFNESDTEKVFRDFFFEKLEAIYSENYNTVMDIAKTKLPYFDMFYIHQKDVIAEAYYKQFNFLAMDMGVGKTITAASLSRIHSFPRTVIICPAAVKFNWFRDLTKKFGFNELLFTILDAARRRTIIALNERFVIINYDIVTKFESHLTSMKVDHFILDEAHNLKSHLTGRTKNVLRVISQFKDAKVTFLSGTPIKNRVDDVFSYLKLSGHELGSNHKKFLSEFTISANGRGGERVTGGRNLKDLNLKLSNFMIRKTKEECLDLPDKVFLSYRFELEDYREEYDKIIKALSEMKEISSLTGNLHSLNIITSKAKIPGIIEIAEQIIAEGRKVVIFGSYKEPLAVLEKHFGHRCVKIDGSVDSYNRDVLVQRFIEDEECTVFLGNMIAAGVGINLVNSSDVLFMNFPFTPSELYQSIDRVHRIGQDKSVNVHLTFCDASIDDYIYEIIIDKEKDINAVIDQGKETMAKENFTEILMRKLLGREVPEHILEDEAKAEEHRDVIISSITKADDSDLPVFL